MNCSACGSSALVSGTILETSGGGVVAFKADEVSTLKSMFGIGYRKVQAYGCVHCGHLQLAVEFTDEDRKRYQQFDGEQPGVIERINSEPDPAES
jgi:hypothetical protein